MSQLRCNKCGRLVEVSDEIQFVEECEFCTTPEKLQGEVSHFDPCEEETNPIIQPLLKRVFLFLEDKEWKKADEYCEKVLDIDPENAAAYLGKLMVEFQISKIDDLTKIPKAYNKSKHYQKLFRYAEPETCERLNELISIKKQPAPKPKAEKPAKEKKVKPAQEKPAQEKPVREKREKPIREKKVKPVKVKPVKPAEVIAKSKIKFYRPLPYWVTALTMLTFAIFGLIDSTILYLTPLADIMCLGWCIYCVIGTILAFVFGWLTFKNTDKKIKLLQTIIENAATPETPEPKKPYLISNKKKIRRLAFITTPITIFAVSFWLIGGIVSYQGGDYGYHVEWMCLTNFTIPDGVTDIESGDFSGCHTLRRITIPASVTSIDEEAFMYCDNLKEISVDENNNYYQSIDGNLYTKDGKILIQYARRQKQSSFTIPDGVTEISSGAFLGCKKLTSITIPDSVITIGDRAFWRCENLESVTMSDNAVVNISHNAFDYCHPSIYTEYENGQYVQIGDNPYAIFVDVIDRDITSHTIHENTKIIASTAFSNYKKLISLTIPEGVTTISDYAFSECNNLISIILPDSLISIGESAFDSCSNLMSISIPKNVTWMDATSFVDCINLKSIRVDENNNVYQSIGGNLYSKDKETLIRYAGGQNLSSFTIPDGVTSIGDWAFSDCSRLASITIPDSVTSIGDYAFYSCDSLTSITIPDGVTSIGSSAFSNCNQLESITIPDGVTSIGNDAFYSCDSLTSITIPDSVTFIGDSAFQYCSALTNVTIPNSVTSIGFDVFDGCHSSLYTEYEAGQYIQIGDNPYAILVSIMNKDATSHIIHKDTKIIDAFAFGCSQIESIIIPDGVTSIGDEAFSDCSQLESITIPDSVTSIGDAFDFCDSLKTIKYCGTKAQWKTIIKNSYIPYGTKITYNYKGN